MPTDLLIGHRLLELQLPRLVEQSRILGVGPYSHAHTSWNGPVSVLDMSFFVEVAGPEISCLLHYGSTWSATLTR
jgi:hypothetical protein